MPLLLIAIFAVPSAFILGIWLSETRNVDVQRLWRLMDGETDLRDLQARRK